MKLIRKTHHHYIGKVHDLTVSNTHSYNVEGLAVHNSAAGSLVSYLTNITSVDPIRWGLMFSRFLRKDAKDMPDIDFDVAAPMELKEELAKEWGSNCVVPISNWNTLQLRSLLKDISKFYDIPFQEVNQVTSKMLAEATPQAKRDHGITAGVYNPTFEELMKYSQSLRKFLDKYPQVKTHVKVLNGQVRSASRHAGGIIIAENLNKIMPLIRSGGVLQTPWSEGQNVRHLEPLGFIKFDLLGLASLRMIDSAIQHILRRHKGVDNPTFEDVFRFYDEYLHPDKIDFNDQSVYENIFHKGKWIGVFQFTAQGAQNFCMSAKPTTLMEISNITAIYRPGPLSISGDKLYLEAKRDPDEIDSEHPIVEEILKDTYGILVYQEQIAKLAHVLGENISEDDGNLLRKLLTKKGTGDKEELKQDLKERFIRGSVKKGLSKKSAEGLFKRIEYFSAYGFNLAHSVSYSMLSFQCAWLCNYYPSEWSAAFLDKEPEQKKEKAINIVKSHGFNIQHLDVNKSGKVWEISEDGRTLIQPLTSIKGLGEAAIDQILDNRPFKTVEHFLYSEEIVYSKLNKKCRDALVKSGAMNCLIDDRFEHQQHFWACVADKPKTIEKFHETIEFTRGDVDFTEEEKIQHLVSLTGVFPMSLVMTPELEQRLEEECVPPLSEYDLSLGVAWFIPREVIPKKTKNGKDYYIVEAIDSTNTTTKIKCWGVNRERDIIHVNRPYMAQLKYSEDWGFSCHSVRHSFVLLA